MNRRISVNTTGFAVPQSFITKSKQRLKQHVDTVYLNNGDEFEIELFNPTQNKVLSKIEINGISIGSGITIGSIISIRCHYYISTCCSNCSCCGVFYKCIRI